MCENEHFLRRFVRDCNDFLVWGSGGGCVFLKCFVGVYLKCFAAGRGTKIGFVFFLKCFAAGWGPKIRFAHLVPLPAGVTENKESVFH